MNSNSRNALDSNSPSEIGRPDSGEATLRVIAQLPPPAGIEDRVLASLRTARRSGRLFSWPSVLQPSEAWLRSAAAAAIVVVVAGGGWSIYLHVEPPKPNTTLAAPPQTGGFSSAGAMRTPQTVTGPVIARPANTQPKQSKPAAKASSQIAPAGHHRVHAAAASKLSGHSAAAR